jgi:hypothetical protein
MPLEAEARITDTPMQMTPAVADVAPHPAAR